MASEDAEQSAGEATQGYGIKHMHRFTNTQNISKRLCNQVKEDQAKDKKFKC